MEQAMPKNEPFFSIVIPVFNRSEMITDTLNSIIGQTFSEFEILVVDDCSDDFPQLVDNIAKLNEPRVRILRHEKNANGAAARNTGIKNAQGQYISFLDSDDTWPSGRLELIKQLILDTPDASSTIFYGQVDFKFPDEETGEIRPKVGIQNSRVGDYLFMLDGLIQTSTIVCHKDVALNILFDERFRRHQDYDFCLRAENLGYPFHFVDSVLSNWLRHVGASTFAKGATYTHCKFWFEEMRQYMSPDAARAYCAKVLAPIAIESGSPGKGLALLLKNIGALSNKQKPPTLVKCIKGFAKYILRVIK